MKSIVLKPHEAKGIHDGSITELWREVKPQPGPEQHIDSCQYNKTGWAVWDNGSGANSGTCTCNNVAGYWPGTRLWCKETSSAFTFGGVCAYRADVGTEDEPIHGGWESATHMKREWSRTTIEITAVSVERREGKWHWKYTVKTVEG